MAHCPEPLMKKLPVVAPGALRQGRSRTLEAKFIIMSSQTGGSSRHARFRSLARSAWTRRRHWTRCSIGTSRGPVRRSCQDRESWNAPTEKQLGDA